MALTTVNVTGTFNFPDASWASNTQAEFMISGYDTDTEVVVPDVVKSTLGSSGELDVDLWGNDDGIRGTVYRVNIVLYSDAGLTREVKRIDLGKIQINGDGPLDIADLLDSPVSVPGAWYSTITEDEYNAAIQAVDDAQAWAESPTAPGDPGTKSAKTWAGEAEASAVLADARADDAASFAGFRDFKDLTTLLANTSLDYGGGASQVAAGDIIRTRSEGFSYQVAASGASDHHVTTAGGVKLYVEPVHGLYNVDSFGAVGDGATDDSAAIAAALAEKSVRLGEGVYLSNSSITVQGTLHWLGGNGWRRDTGGVYSGSVLKGGVGVTNLLTIEPAGNDGSMSTAVTGVKFSDFAIDHRGSGHALKVDNIIWPVLDRVNVFGGDTGVDLDNNSFFAEIRNCRITEFSDTGLMIKSDGSQHAVTNCQISSSQTGVRYGIRTQAEGSLFQGGQVNVNRTDDTGIGVWFDNPHAAGIQTYAKGGARGLLVETDIGFKIGTAGNSSWDNVILEDIRADLGLFSGPVAQFTNTRGSQLYLPRIDRPTGGGVLAKWDGAEAINCGVVLGAHLYAVPFDVAAAAVDPWVHFVGTMTDGERDLIHSDTNLTVTVDNVRDNSGNVSLGRSVRRNGTWSNGFVYLLDDAADSISLPGGQGFLSIVCIHGGGVPQRNALIWYQSNYLGEIASIVSGSDFTVDTVPGTLSGTTGPDGDVTVKYDRTSETLFIENRTGAATTWLYQVLHAGPFNF